jgi:type IV secretory pathway TrbD component
LFSGTNIAAGKCRGVVIGTGLTTEIVILILKSFILKFDWWFLFKYLYFININRVKLELKWLKLKLKKLHFNKN